MTEPKTRCVFCGKGFASKAGRKRHNKHCDKNLEHEKNSARMQAVKRRQSRWGSHLITPGDFWDLHDNLSDGAFFALAAEHGIEPEDFIDAHDAGEL